MAADRAVPGPAGPARRRGSRIDGSLRLRITALAVGVVVGVLALTGALLVTAQHRLLEAQLDQALMERADELQAEIMAAGGAPAVVDPAEDPDIAWQLLDCGLHQVARSAGWVLQPSRVGGSEVGRQDLRTDGTDAEGHPTRILERTIAGDGDECAWVLVAGMDLEDVQASTRTLTELLAIAIPLVAIVLALLVWWLVGRTLRPVEAIREEVAAIGGGSLERRVPVPPGDDEIARLARTMNAMLARLEDATDRQRRFVADASHELRTPITRLRARLETELARDDRADARVALAEVLDETVSLQALIADLLEIARLEAGRERPSPGRAVDLDDLVLAEAARIRASGRVTVDASGVSAAAVQGDEAALARVVANLLDNAARYAATMVRLTLAETAGWAQLDVLDDGPGIPEVDRERVFERFARLDAARGRQTGGTGLGLAISREIAQALGGTLEVVADGGPGAHLVLRLPAARD